MTFGIKLGPALLAVLGSLLLTPVALASGGADSGGSGGGGTSTGGGTAGGTATAGGATGGGGRICAVSSLSNSVGYYSTFAAIWTSYGISGCPNGATWRMEFRNDATGNVDFTSGGSVATRGGGASGTVDEDWAAFSTPYTVIVTVTDSNGNPLASRSAGAVTPSARPAA